MSTITNTYLPGQAITILPEYRDGPEDEFGWRVVEDRGERVLIEAVGLLRGSAVENPQTVVGKEMIAPLHAPPFKFEVVTDAARVEQITGTPMECAALFVFNYSDGVTGWAELGRDGFFCAAVENDTECFSDVAATAEWLYVRCRRL